MTAIKKGMLVSFILIAVSFFLVRFISEKYNSDSSSQVLNKQFEDMNVKGIPLFESETIDGSKYKLSSGGHKVLIINFWASWCGPCVEEFPSLIKLVQKYSGEVGVIAVSLDSNKKEMLDFLDVFAARKEKNWVFLWDPEFKVAENFGTYKLPESYIVTEDFKLIKKVAGSIDWMRADVLQLIEDSVQLN